jgi:thiamine-monophosphate kinase
MLALTQSRWDVCDMVIIFLGVKIALGEALDTSLDITEADLSFLYIGVAVPSSETHLIAGIRRRAKSAATKALVTGIGDDCAVLRLAAGHEALVTTDLSIEGVHFRRDWHPADSVGHRCLARGLSDIAAMGGEPVAAFLSLAAPADLQQSWVDKFLDGLLKLARRFNVPLAGGDVAESPRGTVADIVVLGSVPAGKALTRSGARPGDYIYVTGELGRSAAVLHALKGGQKVAPRSAANRAHFFPEPRLAVGRVLRGIASAAIDVSDGLSTDLAHICQESGVGAVINEHSLPRGIHSYQSSSLHFALHGGEDYELLFTASPKAKVPARVGKVRITRIGEVISERGRLYLADSHGQRKHLVSRGWEHFGAMG